MLTTKNYEAIAEVIRSEVILAGRTPQAIPRLRRMANQMADYFESDNPRFEREVFLAACHLWPENI